MPEFTRNFRDILETRKIARAHRDEEDDQWLLDDEGVENFNYFFKNVLFGKKLEDIVRTLRESKGNVAALNVFGGTKVLEDLEIDSGFAIKLKQKRAPEKGSKVIEGDVLSKATWREIPDNLDLVLSMGRGALYDLPDNANIFYFLINTIWNKMNASGSIALFQVPRWMKSDFESWAKKVSESGVQINYSLTHADDSDKDTYYAVLLLKDEESPVQLPSV